MRMVRATPTTMTDTRVNRWMMIVVVVAMLESQAVG